jgi:hypothetical protein
MAGADQLALVARPVHLLEDVGRHGLRHAGEIVGVEGGEGGHQRRPRRSRHEVLAHPARNLGQDEAGGATFELLPDQVAVLGGKGLEDVGEVRGMEGPHTRAQLGQVLPMDEGLQQLALPHALPVGPALEGAGAARAAR